MRLTKLGKGEVPQQLAALRDARNGVTHMGWGSRPANAGNCWQLV